MVHASPPVISIGTGNDVTFNNPYLNGYNVILDGAPNNPAELILNDQAANTLNNITVGHTFGPPMAGIVQLGYPSNGLSMTLTHGLDVANGSLTIGTSDGGYVVLDGSSDVEDGGSFTAYGGRYHADSFVLNGSLTVESNSIANFNDATLRGGGTVNLGTGSTVDMKTVVAGLHVNVGQASVLRLLQPNSAGMIHEAAGGFVFVGGATSAAKEVFHQATGVMDLLNKAGAQVASVQFAPGSHEYASTLDLRTGPGGSVAGSVTGSIEITTNPLFPGNLPTTFTH
jgi:hypothetical protein